MIVRTMSLTGYFDTDYFHQVEDQYCIARHQGWEIIQVAQTCRVRIQQKY